MLIYAHFQYKVATGHSYLATVWILQNKSELIVFLLFWIAMFRIQWQQLKMLKFWCSGLDTEALTGAQGLLIKALKWKEPFFSLKKKIKQFFYNFIKRFANSSSVGELIVNFNNPGWLQHYHYHSWHVITEKLRSFWGNRCYKLTDSPQPHF